MCVRVCNADVDVRAAYLTYNSTTPIVRNRGGVYSFTLTLNSSAKSRNIPPARDGNWWVTYLMDNVAHDSDSVMQTMVAANNLSAVQLSQADYKQGLGAGCNASITVHASINFGFTTCEMPLFLCVYVRPDTYAAFIDTNTANNVICLSLDSYKDCSPGMLAIFILKFVSFSLPSRISYLLISHTYMLN
jgi:hypothetical protein